MKGDRQARVNALLQRELSEQIFRLGDAAGLDLARVTLTRVEISSDLRQAWVYVSVRADETGQREALRSLHRMRPDLQQAINRDMHIKYTPRLRFRLDGSLEAGDKVLQILADIEPTEEQTEDHDRTGP